MTNIHQNLRHFFINDFEMKMFFVYTCGSSLQSWSEGRHHAGISDLSWLSHSDLEGTAGDVAAIESNINRMNSIFSRDEPDGVLVCRNTRMTNESLILIMFSYQLCNGHMFSCSVVWK